MVILSKWVPAAQAWNSLGELLSICLVKVNAPSLFAIFDKREVLKVPWPRCADLY
jgi:hypothetical protein